MTMSASFGRHEHITRTADFQRAYTQGKKIVSASFIMYLYILQDRPYCRLGITASKKKVGQAVIRNRCKRLVRELFRRNKMLFPTGADVVMVVKRDMVEKKYAELVTELCRTLQA